MQTATQLTTLSRRRFLGVSALGMAAASCLTNGAGQLSANPLGFPIGCQTWPVRQDLGRDFEGTLHRLAAAGYQTIEMCSPPGYAMLGFGPLASLKAADMRAKIRAAGLQCESCHYSFAELKQHLDERLVYAQELGLKQMVISTFSLPNRATLADWLRAAEESNKIGERIRQAGIQLVFHNHNFEFARLDGELIYDKLLGAFNPAAVKMQFQVAVVELGYQAADYFEKYPGRFVSMHLADWSSSEKKQVALGQGVVDWKRLFATAQTAGIKNYFLEMDEPLMTASLPFLRKL